jgi:hypothetical protein
MGEKRNAYSGGKAIRRETTSFLLTVTDPFWYITIGYGKCL